MLETNAKLGLTSVEVQKRLEKQNIPCVRLCFPNYDSPSSSLVKMYLSGEFGENAKDVSPYIASTFYAADRYATFQKEYKKYYDEGGIILADRYTTANIFTGFLNPSLPCPFLRTFKQVLLANLPNLLVVNPNVIGING